MKIQCVITLMLGMGITTFCGAADNSVLSDKKAAGIKASTLLKTQTSWDGKPIVYPKGQPEVTGMMIEIAPGQETGWHLHPANSFGMVLQGDIEISLKNGAVKRLTAGDALAEVAGTLHNGKNVGAEVVKIAVFYVGEVGQKITIVE